MGFTYFEEQKSSPYVLEEMAFVVARTEDSRYDAAYAAALQAQMMFLGEDRVDVFEHVFERKSGAISL
jgi:hypothetical protein